MNLPPHIDPAEVERRAKQTDTSATDSLETLLDRLRRGEGDVIYPAGDAIAGFEIGPHKITVIGAPPGAGKTAITMQIVFELLAADPTIKVVVANAEMPFDVLLKREITRRSGVPAKALRFADLTPKQLATVEAVAVELGPLVDRIRVMEPPFTNEGLANYLPDDKPGLLVVDYLQKFSSGDDARIGTNQVMGTLRTLAHAGWGVLALSATTRNKVKGGSGHDSNALNLASFKESGEIEFNADACYLLRDCGPVDEGNHRIRSVKLDCVKNRHGEQESFDLSFNMPKMTFERPLPNVEPDADLVEWSEGNPFANTESCVEASF